MSVNIKKQGHYELFCTTEDHRILVLDDEQWFAWVEGDQGEILVRSDADHEKDHTLREGDYHLIDFEDDPKFKDMPHLFLQDGDDIDEIMVPNGLPTDSDYQKKVVGTDDTLSRSKLESYLEDPAPSGGGEDRREHDVRGEGDVPFGGYRDMTVDEISGKLGDLSQSQLQKVEEWERGHKERKTVLEAVDRELDQDGS